MGHRSDNGLSCCRTTPSANNKEIYYCNGGALALIRARLCSINQRPHSTTHPHTSPTTCSSINPRAMLVNGVRAELMSFPFRRPAAMGPRVSGGEAPEAEADDREDNFRGHEAARFVRPQRSSSTVRGAPPLLRPEEVREAGGHCSPQQGNCNWHWPVGHGRNSIKESIPQPRNIYGLVRVRRGAVVCAPESII